MTSRGWHQRLPHLLLRLGAGPTVSKEIHASADINEEPVKMLHPDLHSTSSRNPLRDRRRYPRYSVQVPIELQIEDSETVLRAETTDLSRNGCYIRLKNPLPVALWVHARLWLGRVPIQVEGRIVTRHPEFGNGIMFLKVPERDEQTLATYLEGVTAEATV